jgi:hypothetical protein
MVERMDIDALLIGALYSELTPADEARLTAHLESHPGDRAVLDDLKSARLAVRESRILEVQLEPPQAVSAMLLQEAARRAPRRMRAQDEKESWFARFASSFMRHPAMAAAAMLVLVVGVAGTIYMKNGDHFAEKSVASGPPPAAATEQKERELKREDRADLDHLRNEADEATQHEGKLGVAAGSSATFDVDLAGKNQVQPTPPATVTAIPKPESKPAAENVERWKGNAKPSAHAGVTNVTSAKKSAKKPTDYIEVNASDPSPKDMTSGGDTIAKSDAAKTKVYKPTSPKATIAQDQSISDPEAQADQRAATGATTTTATGPTNGANAYAPPPPSKAAPSKQGSKPNPQPRAPSAPVATPPPKPQQIAADKPGAADAKTTGKTADDNSLIAWAKGQHAQAVTTARAGRCQDAAKIALAVQNRAPDYYSQFMATDRALKTCQQYINDARDKDAEQSAKSRAQKRVNSESPAPAADSK